MALTAYYFPLLVEGREYFVSDHTYFFEPFARLIREGWMAQRPPLWNPYIYCGSPQLANPSPGMFYFPNFLFVAFSYSTALALIQFFHQLVAFAGSYLFSRMLRFSVASSAFVGLTIALSGYFFSLPANYTLPATFAWGVLALYSLASVAQRHNWLAYVVLSIFAVHWMLMAGRPEIYVPFFVMFAFLILLMVLKLFELPGEEFTVGGRIKIAFWQSLAIGLGILMSMAMLLPVYEWSKLSPRASGLDLNQVFNWSCNWYDYLCLAFSQPLGDLQQPRTLFGGAVASRDGYFPFLPSAYIGPIVVTLVFFGLADKTFKYRFYALGAALVAVLLSLGKYGPVSALLLKALPFLSILRYPVKLLIFVILFLAILAGRGLHSLEEGQRNKVAIILSLSFWSLATAIATTFNFAPDWVHSLLPRFSSAFYQALGHPMIFTSLIGLIFSLFIALSNKLKIVDRQAMALIVVAALIGSLIVPAFQCRQKTALPGYFDYEGVLLKKLKLLREAEPDSEANVQTRNQASTSSQSTILPPRLLTVYFDPLKMPRLYQAGLQRECINGEAYMQYCREMLLPNICIDWHQPVTFGYESAETKDYRATFLKFLHRSSIDKKSASDDELARFCKITSTRYVASSIIGSGKKGPTRLLSKRWFKLLDEEPDYNLRLYEVLETLPRAFVASSWVKRTQEQILGSFLKGPSLPGAGVYIEEDQKLPPASDWFANFDGANGDTAGDIEVRKVSGIAPGEQNLPSTNSSESEPGQASANKVTFLQDQNEHVALSVQCDKDSLVVLNDRFYPGWKAKVDSVPATIYRANGFMRSVYVTKGSHLVEFDFRPDSLRFGFYLAALAILITLVLAMISLAKPARWLFRFLTTGQK
ncbi:hypothetical protein KBI23_05415 [bacterium]|nr:hypothetical protein [bacterium]MBP9807896.1 hypothetical protein [bacterium]